MRITIRIALLLLFTLFCLANGQEPLTLVGKPAPQFSAQAVVGDETPDVSLADYEGKIKILVFYPADFSFICPTELFAFQEKLKDFEQRNAVILAISVDQIYCHQKWLEIPARSRRR